MSFNHIQYKTCVYECIDLQVKILGIVKKVYTKLHLDSFYVKIKITVEIRKKISPNDYCYFHRNMNYRNFVTLKRQFRALVS